MNTTDSAMLFNYLNEKSIRYNKTVEIPYNLKVLGKNAIKSISNTLHFHWRNLTGLKPWRTERPLIRRAAVFYELILKILRGRFMLLPCQFQYNKEKDRFEIRKSFVENLMSNVSSIKTQTDYYVKSVLTYTLKSLNCYARKSVFDKSNEKYAFVKYDHFVDNVFFGKVLFDFENMNKLAEDNEYDWPLELVFSNYDNKCGLPVSFESISATHISKLFYKNPFSFLEKFPLSHLMSFYPISFIPVLCYTDSHGIFQLLEEKGVDDRILNIYGNEGRHYSSHSMVVLDILPYFPTDQKSVISKTLQYLIEDIKINPVVGLTYDRLYLSANPVEKLQLFYNIPLSVHKNIEDSLDKITFFYNQKHDFTPPPYKFTVYDGFREESRFLLMPKISDDDKNLENSQIIYDMMILVNNKLFEALSIPVREYFHKILCTADKSGHHARDNWILCCFTQYDEENNIIYYNPTSVTNMANPVMRFIENLYYKNVLTGIQQTIFEPSITVNDHSITFDFMKYSRNVLGWIAAQIEKINKKW